MKRRQWCVMDLVTDPTSGKLRETLLWSNLGKVSALIWFSHKCYHDTDSPELWLIVMGVLTCHAAFSQFLMARGGTTTVTATTETATAASVVTTTEAKP